MPTTFEQELAREQAAVTIAEQIKDDIKTVAENKGLTVEETDTPLSVLTKIDNSTIATPTEMINITENGTVDVTNYASADVNVPSSTELPAFMSAKNFTFVGNTCTGYVGDNSLPEIVIPKSYSKTSTTQAVDGVKILSKFMFCEDVSRYGNFMNAEFSDGADHTTSYSDPMAMREQLGMDFPEDCYLVSMSVERPEDFEWIHIIPSNAGIIQYPINVNGQTFNESYDAFNYILGENLTDVNFSGDIEIISYIDGNDYQVTEVSCIEPTESGFKNYKNRIILLSNITEIGHWAFQDCTNLTSIEIPNSVTNMGVQVFMGCSNLINVVLPEGITKITVNEFHSCRSLTSINIPSSVTIIDSAFDYCSSLRSVTIPENVTSIGGRAFYSCTNLTTVTLEATTPPTIQSNTFDDTVQRYEVPAESVGAYKTATNWANYADKIFAISTV